MNRSKDYPRVDISPEQVRGLSFYAKHVPNDISLTLLAQAARIAELEEDCVRLGQGEAERYWEGRWRDETEQFKQMKLQIKHRR